MDIFIILGLVIIIIFIRALFYKSTEEETITKVSEKDEIFYNESLDLARFLEKKFEYMHSSLWKEKRKRVIEKAEYQCEICGSGSNLQVHHLRGYDQIPFESTRDLVCLCAHHHKEWHKKYGYPKSYKDYMNWDFQKNTIYTLDSNKNSSKN